MSNWLWAVVGVIPVVSCDALRVVVLELGQAFVPDTVPPERNVCFAALYRGLVTVPQSETNSRVSIHLINII